jgi:hypothetical protein
VSHTHVDDTVVTPALGAAQSLFAIVGGAHSTAAHCAAGVANDLDARHCSVYDVGPSGTAPTVKPASHANEADMGYLIGNTLDNVAVSNAGAVSHLTASHVHTPRAVQVEDTQLVNVLLLEAPSDNSYPGSQV